MTQTEQTSARIRYQRKLAKPPRKLRPYGPRFRAAPSPDDPDFHDLQIAVALYHVDHNRTETDALIRDACHDAADEDDLDRAERISSLSFGMGVGQTIGPRLGCEILAALGRFLDDCENGKEPT